MTNIIEIICENLGGRLEVQMGTPLSEVVKKVAPGPYPFLAALVNNRIKELYYKIYTPVTVRFVDITSPALPVNDKHVHAVPQKSISSSRSSARM